MTLLGLSFGGERIIIHLILIPSYLRGLQIQHRNYHKDKYRRTVVAPSWGLVSLCFHCPMKMHYEITMFFEGYHFFCHNAVGTENFFHLLNQEE